MWVQNPVSQPSKTVSKPSLNALFEPMLQDFVLWFNVSNGPPALFWGPANET